jgi:hypothetical protein
MQTDLMLFLVVKALLELAGLVLFAQGALHLWAGAKRNENRLYALIRALTSPVTKFARIVTPKSVVDRYIPYVAFLLVLWAWLFLVFWVLPGLCGSGTVDCGPLVHGQVHT